MNGRISAFIFVRSGRIRESLAALVRAIPQIESVELLDENMTALESLPDRGADLVLLDAGLMNQGVWTFMKQVKGHPSQSQCKYIVLAENTMQKRMAQAAGADSVLLAGFRASEFFGAVEQLFGQPAATVNGREKDVPITTS